MVIIQSTSLQGYRESNEDAEIIFAHPGELRSGILDDMIDKYTAICDLPMHPRCGLNIDHHRTNKIIDDSQTNGIFIWKDYPSAARIAYEIISEVVDLSDLEELLFSEPVENITDGINDSSVP